MLHESCPRVVGILSGCCKNNQSPDSAYWDATIKGDVEHSDYPALIFYNKVIPWMLGDDYAFVRNLIVPEADFDDILGEKTGFSGQSVDFYLPQAKMVIEIDGYSHREYAQRKKDEERDAELRKRGIEVFRVQASGIKEKTQEFFSILKSLTNNIKDNEEINSYKKALDDGLNKHVISKETVMRLQIALITCLMEQKINTSKDSLKIYVSDSDIDHLLELLVMAYKDLSLWFYAIAGLLHLEEKLPKLIITENEKDADLIINYSLFRRYDDNCLPRENEIIIRTDYFPSRDCFRVAGSNTLKYQLNPKDNPEDKNNLLFILENIFGYESFAEGQLDIITNILNGRDTVGILPTGAGKSLCYQFPSMLQPGVTVVVAPIISLMIDQKRSLGENYGMLHNNMISSVDDGSDKGRILSEFRQRRYQIMWMSPERFQSQVFRESLSVIGDELNICYAVIDEVHCLSEWGHDFRISYLTLIKTLRSYCPSATLVGLTATASEFVLKDVMAEFGIDGAIESDNVISAFTMDRKELSYIRKHVGSDREREKEILEIIKREKGNHGAIFCKTIKATSYNNTSCQDMNNLLHRKNRDGVSAVKKGEARLFHGKLSQSERIDNQNAFLNNEFPIMICTKAFGMGIDKQNLRFTIHNSLPSSAESFYQEAGRAGRDRVKSRCYIVYDVDNNVRERVKKLADSRKLLDLISEETKLPKSDFETTRFFMRTNHVDEKTETQQIYNVLIKLKGMTVIPFQGSGDASKQKTEQALYKLSLLGIVEDWTVNYYSLDQGECVVRSLTPDKISSKDALEHLKKYIRKYDSDFDFSADDYGDLIHNDRTNIVDVICALVRWTNNNIVYQHIQCAKTMMDWCSPAVNDDDFRLNLEGYFRFDEVTAILKYIADNPKDWKAWFKVFYSYDRQKENSYIKIDKEKARSNHAGLQRFLESYQNNLGLNYIDGLIQVLYKESMSEADITRMKQSLMKVREAEQSIQTQILRNTLEIAKDTENQLSLEMLSKTIIEFFPEYSRMTYDYLKDRYSLSIELEKAVKRMEDIKWII